MILSLVSFWFTFLLVRMNFCCQSWEDLIFKLIIVTKCKKKLIFNQSSGWNAELKNRSGLWKWSSGNIILYRGTPLLPFFHSPRLHWWLSRRTTASRWVLAQRRREEREGRVQPLNRNIGGHDRPFTLLNHHYIQYTSLKSEHTTWIRVTNCVQFTCLLI